MVGQRKTSRLKDARLDSMFFEMIRGDGRNEETGD